MIAGGNAHVDGLLSADGYPGRQDTASGGSGGAIFVTLGGRLTGSGALQARGVLSATNYPAGGGGRIAIWPDTSPAEAAQRIADMDLGGRTQRATVSSFTGQLDASAALSSAISQAGDGTAGFYVRALTLIVIR